jgi:hypothetical protein
MAPLMVAAKHTDKKVGDGHICRHHRVGMGYSESTPLETSLPARMLGPFRVSVKKRVAQRGIPYLNEPPTEASRQG